MKRTNFRLSQTSFITSIGLRTTATLDGYMQKVVNPYTSTASGYYHIFSHIQNKNPLTPGVNKNGLPYNTSDNPDRKSTRLNSSHANISYAVFCLKKTKSVRRADGSVGHVDPYAQLTAASRVQRDDASLARQQRARDLLPGDALHDVQVGDEQPRE